LPAAFQTARLHGNKLTNRRCNRHQLPLQLPKPPQISLETRDVFIECTATDLTKAKVVLNTVCSMFSEYCSSPYVVEPVEVIDSFGESHGERQCSRWYMLGAVAGCL
jgi:hypothetical protein